MPVLRHLRRALHRGPGGRTAADQLGDRGMLACAGIYLNPVPRTDGAQQLIVGGAGIRVLVPGRIFQKRGQHRAARRGIQGLASGEPGRRARVLAGEGLRRPGHPRAPAAGHRGADGGQRGGVAEPGRGLGGPRLADADLAGLGEQRGQLGVVEGGRGVVGVLVVVRVAGVLVLGAGREVGGIIHPVRPGRNQAGVVPPGVLGNRCFAHEPRSVRMNDLVSNMIAKNRPWDKEKRRNGGPAGTRHAGQGRRRGGGAGRDGGQAAYRSEGVARPEQAARRGGAGGAAVSSR